MILTVRMPEWELEEARRVLSVGDQFRSWLTFHEAGVWVAPPEQINVLRGLAVPLPTWPGAEFGRHPAQINIGGATLYWDAPQPIAGPVEVTGTVSTNNVDAPDGFPDTTGVLRKLRMEWQEFTKSPDGAWRSGGASARYEEVTATYLPSLETEILDSQAERELLRQAQKAHDRELAAGGVKPGEPFEVTLQVPYPRHPPGTTRTRWTGVLIDLEIAEPTHS